MQPEMADIDRAAVTLIILSNHLAVAAPQNVFTEHCLQDVHQGICAIYVQMQTNTKSRLKLDLGRLCVMLICLLMLQR